MHASRGASPGAQIVLLAGVNLGSTPVPGCPGVTIPLRTPRVLSASNADIAFLLVDAARGVGYGRRQLLWRVQVPLATPTILAGIRIATVSTVGLVTIGALVGHGGFGTVILGGFVNTFYHAQILAGTIAVVVMALLLEGLLILLERLLTPWTRVKGSW